MLTNQMRGRALRIDPAQPVKAASIWHIVAFDPAIPAAGADYEELVRRFQTFVGLAENRPVIEANLGVLLRRTRSPRSKIWSLAGWGGSRWRVGRALRRPRPGWNGPCLCV